jgi:hypothetical protein
MIQIENSLMDLDEMWYEHCAIGSFPKIVFLSFLQSSIPEWQMNVLVRWDQE